MRSPIVSTLDIDRGGLGVSNDVGEDLAQRLHAMLRALGVQTLSSMPADHFNVGEYAETSLDLGGERLDAFFELHARPTVLVDLEDRGADLMDRRVEFVQHVVDAFANVVVVDRGQ